MSVSFNPNPTTNISGSFVTTTEGFVQGVFLDDPALRYQLAGGIVDANASGPLWGGIPVTVLVPTLTAASSGPVLDAAAAYTGSTGINGWAVFNQGAAGIITPTSNVPQYPAGTSINFFYTGSGARIPVPIDSTILASLEGNPVNTQVSWDFTNNKIIAFSSTALPVVIEAVDTNSKIVSVSGGNYTWTTGAVAIIKI